MSVKICVMLLTLWGAFTSVTAQSAPSGTIEIRFTGIRDSGGLIAIGVNRNRDGWPRDPHMDFNWEKTGMVDGVFIARIENLVYGTYAISVLDDENSNLEMDMFMGIPREGWGFSMNPPFKLSTPDFEECSFLLSEPLKRITIDLRYAGRGR